MQNLHVEEKMKWILIKKHMCAMTHIDPFSAVLSREFARRPNYRVMSGLDKQ